MAVSTELFHDRSQSFYMAVHRVVTWPLNGRYNCRYMVIMWPPLHTRPPCCCRPVLQAEGESEALRMELEKVRVALGEQETNGGALFAEATRLQEEAAQLYAPQVSIPRSALHA